MTREKLEEYKSKKDEIHELQQKLQHLGEGDSLIGNDVILDYQTGYPRPQSIVGYDYLPVLPSGKAQDFDSCIRWFESNYRCSDTFI